MAEIKNKKNVKKTRQENLDTNKVDSTKKRERKQKHGKINWSSWYKL